MPWKASVFHHILFQMRSITLKKADLPLGRAKVFLDTLHHKQICTRKLEMTIGSDIDSTSGSIFFSFIKF